MGTYCTTTTLETLMVGVTFNTLTSSLATVMIEQAEAEINKYLSKRYDLSSNYFQTSTSVPPLVRTWCQRLSEGYTWHHLSRGGAGDMSLTRGDKLIEPTIENLKMVADYKMDVTDTLGSVIDDMANTSYRVLSNTEDYTDTFAEDDPLVWAVDSDKLDDISDERD